MFVAAKAANPSPGNLSNSRSMDSLPARHPPALRILTINAHKGFTALNRKFVLHELRDAVRSVGADIVFLQEILGVHALHSRRYRNWPAAPQYEFLADEMWPEFAYGRNAVYPAGHHGNALLSKFPIVSHENRDASVHGKEKRGLLYCVLDVPGATHAVHTVCVHLGLRERQRRHQTGQLCQLVEQEIPRQAPLVIAGDFNDWWQYSDARLRQCADLIEIFASATGSLARTFPARWPLLPLDRIYVRGVRVHEPRVLSTRPWSHLSDHTPLAAEIQL